MSSWKAVELMILIQQIVLGTHILLWSQRTMHRMISPGQLCSIFYLLCFCAMLKNLTVMLNIMPMITAIMPQFIAIQFYYFND